MSIQNRNELPEFVIITTYMKQKAESAVWIAEWRKRLTACLVKGIVKMKTTTTKATKVENLLCINFKGNAATRYGPSIRRLS